jgi:hypothetical protein
MRNALVNAFGSKFAQRMRVVDPRSAAFAATPLSPAFYSAIVVASDQTCGKNPSTAFPHGDPNVAAAYCDLNRPPGNVNPDLSAWPPPVLETPGALPDSEAIIARSQDIKRFFDSGGGLFVASGADNGDGHTDDRYYAFLDLPGGAEGSACDSNGMGGVCFGSASGLALTIEGRAIGFTDGANGTADDIHCGLGGGGCATHNSFKAPRVGSQLLIAEMGPDANATTLFEDLKVPNAIIRSGPAPRIRTAEPVPIPVVTSRRARFRFEASEDTTAFACELDTSTFTSCASPRSEASLAEGVHHFAVTATDAAHNQDPTPAEVSWLVSADRDRDGYLHRNPFGSLDCNDRNARIHPHAREIRGNRVDENCDTKFAPFIRLRASFPFHFAVGGCRGCIRFTRLAAAALPRHARVTIRCRGKACHLNRRAGRARREGGRISVLRFVRRPLPSGTVVEVRVTHGRAIGAVKRLSVTRRHGRADVTDALLCLPPGGSHARRHCPSIR